MNALHKAKLAVARVGARARCRPCKTASPPSCPSPVARRSARRCGTGGLARAHGACLKVEPDPGFQLAVEEALPPGTGSAHAPCHRHSPPRASCPASRCSPCRSRWWWTRRIRVRHVGHYAHRVAERRRLRHDVLPRPRMGRARAPPRPVCFAGAARPGKRFERERQADAERCPRVQGFSLSPAAKSQLDRRPGKSGPTASASSSVS